MFRQFMPVSAFRLQLMFLLAITGCSRGGDSSGPPRISLPVDAYIDLGALLVNKRKPHALKTIIHNEGWSDLRIEELNLSCACLNGTLSADVIAPGQSAALHIDVSVAGVEERSASVKLITNDPEKPVVQLRWKWTVVEPIGCEPTFVQSNSCEPGRREEFAVKVVRNSPRVDDSWLGDVQLVCSGAGISADWTYAPHKNELGSIIVRIDPTQSHTEVRGQVILRRAADPDEQVMLPVSYRIAAEVSASPNQAFFSALTNAEPLKRIITLRRERDHALEVQSATVEPDDSGVSVQLQRASDRVWLATIVWQPPSAPGVHSWTVRFQCTTPESRELVVPVRAVARAKDSIQRKAPP